MAWEAKFLWRKITSVLNLEILEAQISWSNTIIFFKGTLGGKMVKNKQRMINKQTKTKKISQTHISASLTFKSIMLF